MRVFVDDEIFLFHLRRHFRGVPLLILLSFSYYLKHKFSTKESFDVTQ